VAKPQSISAHLRIAYSINEAIMLRDFSKRQSKIVDLIPRLSGGWVKKESYIPHQRDFEIVGIYQADVKSQLDWLCSRCHPNPEGGEQC